VGDKLGADTHAINCPVAALYVSISWFSFVTPSPAVNTISDPSLFAELARLASVYDTSTGKFDNVFAPDTCA
jgi:hypothetical protein